MKRYKIVKYVDAERMFQSNAELIVGKINNLTYGNDGYLVEDPDNGTKWVPKSLFEKRAIPADSHSELINLMMDEMQLHIDELKKYVKSHEMQRADREKWHMAIRRATQYIADLEKIFNCMKKWA